MDLTKLVEDLTTAKASNLVKDSEMTGLKTQVETLTASNTALKGEVDTLKAAADTKLPEVQAKLDATDASLKVVLGFVKEDADRLAVAAGLDKPADDADFEALKASISASKAKLSVAIPTGGRSLEAGNGSGDKAAAASNASFKTR